MGWWASCSLQNSADLRFCELRNESLHLCRLQAVTCIFLLFIHCAGKGKSHITPQLFVPNWWANPDEADANFESSEVAASCVSLSPASLTGPELLRWFQKQKLAPKLHHLKISSERCLDKLLFSAFKIGVQLEPVGFATWIFRLMGCMFSEGSNHQGVMDGGWPLQQITTGWEMRGGCEWLISRTYCKELKNKGIIQEQLQHGGIRDVSLVAVLKSLLQLFFLYPLSFEILCC